MALQVNYTTSSNIVATYARIALIDNAKIINNSITPRPSEIVVEWWKDVATRDLVKTGGNQTPISVIRYSTLSAFSDIPTTYDYLKTLPDFSGAIDI
jgi:hypothetical protein